jgi:hypothetical protein
VKSIDIEKEKRNEREELESVDAHDAEFQAVRKLKKYKEAVKGSSDSDISEDSGSESDSGSDSDEDTSVMDETTKMKKFFKKSKIYKKYENEKIKEKLEDEEAENTSGQVEGMKTKYMDLMKKYGFVLAQVNKQNEIATQMEEMSKKMPKEDLIMMPEDKSNQTVQAQANKTIFNKTISVNKTVTVN